jgi:subtilisin family serine protease
MKRALFLTILFVLFAITRTSAQERQVITKAEDLPKHSYTLEPRNARAFVKDKEKVLALARQMKQHLESDLASYDIQDRSTLKGYYLTLSMICQLEGHPQQALDHIETARPLADKPAERIVMGIEDIPLIQSAMELGTFDAGRLSDRMLRTLEERLDVADFSVIQNDIEERKGTSEILSENLLMGLLQGETQKQIDNNKGDIPGDLAEALLGLYYALHYYLPYKDIYNKAFTDALEEYGVKVVRVDIWNERNVDLDGSGKYTPVIIGIWDSGVDTAIFKGGNLWTNEREKQDGVDDDGNGFVDDLHGIGYDLEGRIEMASLDPTAHQFPNLHDLQERVKGFADLQANINSNEATVVKQYLASLKPDEVDRALEALSFYGNYCHGTHVAGIAAADNPMAKLMVARVTYDYKTIQTPYTDELVKQWNTSTTQIIDYFKQHGVRVVNMSWAETYANVLHNLETNGIGANDDDRKALATKYFTSEYENFKRGIESAPGILFVASAMNENSDVDFAGGFPSGINLPNLITAGAVDIEGRKTNFTCEGKSVDVFANGFEVESYVPGGGRIPMSGTSMASPMVANLAGKILSVNPALTPEQVIDIIVRTSTTSPEDDKVLLIHPKHAVEAAMKKQ